MRLLSVRIPALRGLPERSLSFADEATSSAPVAAITGPPGSGKSKVLEAIVLHKEHVAPYRMAPGAQDFSSEVPLPRFEVESRWLLSPSEREETASREGVHTARSVFAQGRSETHADPALVHILARFERKQAIAKVDHFGEAWLGPRKGAPAGDLDRWQRIHRLGLGPEKFNGLLPLYAAANSRMKADVGRWTQALLPHLSPEADGSFRTPAGVRLPSELSFGERRAFELAATFILVGLMQSVVLIDGIERVFGARSGQVLATLRELAPEAQLIVTTESPTVLEHPAVRPILLSTS